MRLINKSIQGRVEECRLYDVNIFNFEHAAEQIGSDESLQDFKRELLARAAGERHEKRKAMLILDALRAQRDSLPFWRRWAA